MLWHFIQHETASDKAKSLAIAMTIAALALATPADAEEPRLEQKLRRQISASWQDQELATVLRRLEATGQITVWLDRRVDAQQSVTLQLTEISLAQALQQIAERHALGYTQLANVVYIGPEQSASDLPTLIAQARAQVAKLPAKMGRQWRREKPTQWPRLSEPRSLLREWLDEANVRLLGEEQIPHDLWDARALPPMALVDRAVLLLVGFDLTCEIGDRGETCTVVPIRPLNRTRPSEVPATRERETRPRQAKSTRVFTLRLEYKPLGVVLDQLAEQLSLEISWSAEPGFDATQAREQRVSCDVRNVDLDELLRSVLSATGLRHQLEGNRVTISKR